MAILTYKAIAAPTIKPTVDDLYDLGEETKRFRRILVSSSALLYGDVELEETLPTDHSRSGIVFDAIAGEALAFPNACYLKNDGKWYKADADAAATMPVTALAMEALAPDESGKFLLNGFVRDDSWAWTPGGAIYASTTAGALTQTTPSGSGDQIQIIGVALTATIILFSADATVLEVA